MFFLLLCCLESKRRKTEDAVSKVCEFEEINCCKVERKCVIVVLPSLVINDQSDQFRFASVYLHVHVHVHINEKSVTVVHSVVVCLFAVEFCAKWRG